MKILAPFRIGSVPYLNAVPLTRGIDDQVVLAQPSKLAQMLKRGELDAALVSVTAVLFNNDYDVLDGVAIASLGEVKSVLLGHRRPLSEATEVFCDTASLTSVELLRVLLAEQGLHPVFRPLPGYAKPDELPDYVMLIGDVALEFLESRTQHEVWDLGDAWFKRTGLPFVYAIWALRRGIENGALRRLLRQSKDLGLETLDEIVRSRSEFSPEFLKDYLGWHIHYHLGSEEKRGVAKFAELLRKHRPGPVLELNYVE